MPQWTIEGHAIVSADGCIADAQGDFPDALRNEADWLRFQAALDRAAVVVLGRLSHLAAPNRAGRPRVIVSGAAHGLQRRDDGWWWNPADVPVTGMLAVAAPDGGVVGVPGGRAVFDLFLGHGFDLFDLVRHADLRLPGGVPVLSGVTAATPPEHWLAAAGLRPDPPQPLDAAAGVTLHVWRRPAPPPDRAPRPGAPEPSR